MLTLLIAVIVVALIFDFINGFHDTANAIATSVSTGVLPLRTAVIVAGVFNFIGALSGTAVAGTIAKGLADPAAVTQLVVLAALVGAIAWNLITWYYGIPSSSSHALVGGIVGAVVGNAGFANVVWLGQAKAGATAGVGTALSGGVVGKVLVPLVLSPLIGFLFALLFMIALLWIVARMRPGRVNRGSRRLQLMSACAMAFSHGSNDAQKCMGIIVMALLAYAASGAPALPHWVTDGAAAPWLVWMVSAHHALAEGPAALAWLAHIFPAKLGANNVPLWVMLACALAMGLGTAAGGKRIIKTMGSKIIRITPLQGFAAETGATITILMASRFGIPVSTTHVISSCILGAGASQRLSAVRWGVAANIVIAWVLTLPASALIAWVTILALKACFG